MPELPEVETTRRGLAPHVEGAVLVRLEVHEPRLRWPVPADLPALVAGQRLLGLQRRGKYLLFDLGVLTLIAHLGMSGSWRVLSQGAREERRKHDHLTLHFDNGVRLRYHDPRRFGCLLPSSEPGRHPLIAELGPEPLSDAFTAEGLHARAQGRKVPVKAFLMDTATVVGVGNIYAQEACFLAGIHPARAAGRVSLARYQRLVAEVKQVLAAAIEQGGTTLRDFLNSAGEPGYFQQQLWVYGRDDQPCKRCHTPIRALRIANRGTWFCPTCQT